jgi:mRNA interferase MazF
MSCKPGDLVGIPFPYSDLKAEKRRPVLVIAKEDRHGDFICDKIFTSRKNLIVRHYGSLDDDAFNSIKGEICAYFGCE